MSQRVTVPKACKGFDSPTTGKRYDASSNGHISIDEGPDMAAFKKGPLSQYFSGPITGFNDTGTPSSWCIGCHFEGFAWQTHCPRCNEVMTQEVIQE